MPSERKQRRVVAKPSPAAQATTPPSEPPTASDQRWWVIVVSEDPQLGSGRYGVWEDKPTVKLSDDGNTAIVNARNGHNDEEPTLYVNLRSTLTFSVGQVQHFDAAPVHPDAADLQQG